jgi:uncharacterized protein (DUF58 family)
MSDHAGVDNPVSGNAGVDDPSLASAGYGNHVSGTSSSESEDLAPAGSIPPEGMRRDSAYETMAMPWRPTQAYLRACIVGVGLLVLAVLLHRADGTVVAAPFLVVTAWALATRPTSVPRVRHPVALPTLREGQGMRWQAQVEAVRGLDQATMVFQRADYQELRPASGVTVEVAKPGVVPIVTLGLDARTTRWGHQSVGRTLLSATSSWAAFRWGPVQLEALDQTTLPLPAVFNAAAPTPHPVGLVGLNRAARQGDGSEFATIRPFQLGDRLRRIHWPTSLRSRSLHVAAAWADQDAEIMLLVDATTDLGTSEGIDGAASSLDVTVRAAGAVAEHFLRHGDRVGLVVFGPDVLRLAPAAGRNHLRSLLHELADTRVGNRAAAEGKLMRLHLGANATVIMMSACISSFALRQALSVVGRGYTVVVVDTLPERIAGLDNVALDVAWRIRRLERDLELRRLTEAGVPVVRWHGPGSLDQVLRDLGRRSRAPRMVRR